MSDNIIMKISGGRVYLDFVRTGCGVGCDYCFVHNNKAPQSFYSAERVFNALRDFFDSQTYCPGFDGTVFILSSSSEPFFSGESTVFLELILAIILPRGNKMQIATKSRIPASTIEQILKLRKDSRQVIFYISIPKIRNNTVFEPHAQSTEERLNNINDLNKSNILNCLYIKSFLDVTPDDVECFIDAINKFNPKYVCVGVYYSNAKKGFVHPTHSEMHSPGITQELRLFADKLKESCKIKVFYNSLCVTAYASKTIPTLKVWEDYSHLCINCMNCRALYDAMSTEKRQIFYCSESGYTV